MGVVARIVVGQSLRARRSSHRALEEHYHEIRNRRSSLAMLNNVISIGATAPLHQRNFDRLTSYTNFGRRGVDVFAPGGEYLPERGGVLEDLILAACSPSVFVPPLIDCRDRRTYVLSGSTSHAAAHVSGEAAVIESELPGDQSPAELTGCILQSADPLPNPVLTANGRINVLRGARCGVAKGAETVAARQ